MFLNYKIIIDIIYFIYLTTKTYNKYNLSNKKKENKIALYVVHPHVHTLIADSTYEMCRARGREDCNCNPLM